MKSVGRPRKYKDDEESKQINRIKTKERMKIMRHKIKVEQEEKDNLILYLQSKLSSKLEEIL
jgi:hypothetical protein